MLTTEKWGALPSSRSAGFPDRRPAAPVGATRGARLFGWCVVALPLLLFTACEPPGPAALRKGHHLIEVGRPADAIEPLKRAIRLLGTNDLAVAQAWNHLGLAYHHSQQYEDALAAYQAALGKDFNLFAARYNRGALFLELNNLPAAINELTTYTAHEPRNPDAWLKLGVAQLRARQHEPADRSFQQVLALNAPPSVHAEALNNLGVSNAQRRRTREAFQYFNAALKAQTNHAPAILNQAIVAQQQLGDRRLALGRYRAYLAATKDGPASVEVSALADALELALNPPVIPPVPAPPTNPPVVAVALSNLTEILTRTSAVATLALPPTNQVTGPTAAPPAVVGSRTSAPASRVVVTPAPPVAVQPAPEETPAPFIVAEPVPAPRETPPRAATSPATNEPAPAVVRSRTPPAVGTPSTATNLVPEVVEVAPEPEILVARDVPTTSAPTNTAATLAPLVKPIGSDQVEEQKEKKSLFRRLNPVGWFGGGDEDADQKAREKAEKEAAKEARKRDKQRDSAPTPIPSKPTGEPLPLPSATQPAEPAPAPTPAPTFPRYRYSKPVMAQMGDLPAARGPFEEGVRAQQAKRWAEALASYRRAVNLAPGYFDAWFSLGVTAALSGDQRSALDAYERALALKPADVNCRYNLALALNAAGYPVDAIEELQAVASAKPDLADAHLTLGGIYADQLKDIPKARSHYQKVLELAPRHASAADIRRWLAANR